MNFIEEAFLVGILEYHIELLSFFEVAIHFEYVGMVHEELEFHLLDYLLLHVLFFYLFQVNLLQGEYQACLFLLDHVDWTETTST